MTDYGCDPAAVTLANWRTRPHSKWAFQNAAMLVPTAAIAGGGAPRAEDAPDLASVDIGEGRLLGDRLSAGEVDEMLVTKGGRAVGRWRAPHRAPTRPHLVFSVSKSITGVIAGILADQGALDTGQTVAHYIPAAAQSGYGDCTVRDLLDMRVSLRFSEEYLNEDGDYARYRRAMLWNPAPPGYTAEPLADMLCSLAKGEAAHGGTFRYLSPNSDMLGLVVEAAGGAPFADLMSDLLWRPMECADAQITVDAQAAPRTAGGISTFADDLARLGNLLMTGGGGLVSEAWVADMMSAGDAGAWAASDFADFIPGGRYRSKWYQFPAPSRAFMAVGIHGQWLYVDPAQEVVVTVLSSQHIPQDDAREVQMIGLIQKVVASV